MSDLPDYLKNAPALSADEAAQILHPIPRPPRDEWIKLICATVAAIGETDALNVLTAQFPDEKPNETAIAIRKESAKGIKCSAASLIYLAQAHGFDARAFFKARAARLKEEAGTRPKPVPAAAQSRNEKTDTAPRERRGNAAKPPNASHAGKPAPLPRVDLGKCSICEAANRAENIAETSLLACCKAIKAGEWKSAVDDYRAGKRPKHTLPQVCAYGVYRNRRLDDNLQSRSGFLVLDFDGKDNPNTDFRKHKERLAKLPFTLAAFASPSGSGLTAVIRVPDDVNDSAAFAAAQTLLAPLGGVLDAQSGARKHFVVSHDEGAYVNPAPLDEIPPLPASFDDCAPSVLAVLFADTVERFFFAGKDSYFFRQHEIFKELSKADAAEEFSVRYGANRAAARKALYAVRERRHVSAVFDALTCRRAGMHILDGKRILVRESPCVIDADEGRFPTIRRLVETVFPRGQFNQAWRFLHWLQCARRAFLRCVESGGETVSPTPLLMLLGLKGAGKDLLFNSLINPALGNRRRAGMDTFPQEKQWLGAIVGCECVLGSEMENLNFAQRDRFKSAVKKVLGGEGYDAESKGINAFVFKGQHFLVLLANIDDGGNCAASCPAIEEDFKDKFLALSLMNPEAVKAAFPTKNKAVNAKKLRDELPAFLYWLDVSFSAPDEWQDERFGVKGYAAPVAAEALNEVDASRSVDEKVSHLVEKFPAEMLDKKLTAAEIAKKLGDVFSERAPNPVFLGKELRKLCKLYPKRYRFNASKSSPRYEFFRPSDDDEAADSAPAAVPATDAALADVSPFDGLDF